jgi:hypothetical protein
MKLLYFRSVQPSDDDVRHVPSRLDALNCLNVDGVLEVCRRQTAALVNNLVSCKAPCGSGGTEMPCHVSQPSDESDVGSSQGTHCPINDGVMVEQNLILGHHCYASDVLGIVGPHGGTNHPQPDGLCLERATVGAQCRGEPVIGSESLIGSPEHAPPVTYPRCIDGQLWHFARYLEDFGEQVFSAVLVKEKDPIANLQPVDGEAGVSDA